MVGGFRGGEVGRDTRFAPVARGERENAEYEEEQVEFSFQGT
jgi:hypothetical protein